MFHFTIRDLLWLTVVVAVMLGMYFARPKEELRWEYKVDTNVTHAELNEVGNEGWELVGVETAPNLGGLTFYFKRRK